MLGFQWIHALELTQSLPTFLMLCHQSRKFHTITWNFHYIHFSLSLTKFVVAKALNQLLLAVKSLSNTLVLQKVIIRIRETNSKYTRKKRHTIVTDVTGLLLQRITGPKNSEILLLEGGNSDYCVGKFGQQLTRQCCGG